jgi:hypothetical protein
MYMYHNASQKEVSFSLGEQVERVNVSVMHGLLAHASCDL